MNAELAGLRTRASVESCPFDELPAISPPLPLSLSPTLPLAIIEYTTPDRLAMFHAKRFPHQSSEHPRRGEWGPEWLIAENGIAVGERVLFNADCALQRDETGKEWRQFVDLDRGEFCDWSGDWRPLKITTEARRHGEPHEEASPQEGATAQALGDHPQLSRPSHAHGPEDAPAGDPEVAVLAAPSEGDRLLPAAPRLTPDRSTPLGQAVSPPARTVAAVRVRQASLFDSGGAGSVEPAAPPVIPNLRPALAYRVCEPDEFPEPGEWMSADERLGWRHVRTGRDVACRFGVDKAEDLPRWRAWLLTLKQFREGGPS